ncbi:MAG: WbqC family protein [Planctomycetota bacterium]|nr:WbqC family protein [Planctomycetota bacterium]MDA1180691.1 WbqC family protein [Planctomycetota bacterium]
MKLGIMQPYFFPYLGYFDLICSTDRFVLFDSAQYIRHGWVNRNRILHPTHGWKYVLVPLEKHPQATPIRDVRVHSAQAWRQKIVGQLDHYRRKAPNFKTTSDLVKNALNTEDCSLARLNGRCLKVVYELLDVPFYVEFDSELSLQLGDIHSPGDWALKISQALGASAYVNPIGGASIFDQQRFAQADIELELRPFENLQYACCGYEFQTALSIIDVLMWNSPETVKRYLSGRAVIGNGTDVPSA